MTPEQSWDDDESHGPCCHCVCHGVVVMADDEQTMKGFMRCPPRFDNAQAWMESCKKCGFDHWVAASVHNQVTSIEADERENLSIYYVNHPRIK